MFFIGGGGLGGRGAVSADNTPAQRKTPLKPPPKTPPFFKFGSGGVFKHDIRFLRIPPPPGQGPISRPPTGLVAARGVVALGAGANNAPALGANGRGGAAPPRAQELAVLGVPGAGAAPAQYLRGLGRGGAPSGTLGRPVGGLHGGGARHPLWAVGRGHVDGKQGGGACPPAVRQLPLVPRSAGDGATHPVGLVALGFGAPSVDAWCAAGGQGVTSAGVTRGLAGVPKATGLLPLALVGEGEEAQT